MKPLLLFLVLVLQGYAYDQRGEWKKVEKSESSEEVQVILAIKRANRDWLERKLRAVSYPDSPEYGNYMSFSEIAENVYGRPESVEAVLQTLESAGIGRHKIDFTVGRDFAVVKLAVKEAEAIFAAEFYRFKNAKNSKWTTTRTLSYSIPSKLHGHLDFICCFDLFPRQNPLTSPLAVANTLDETITPRVINDAYDLEDYSASNPSSSQAVASFLKQYFDPSDLEKFQKRFSLPVNPIAKIVGKNDENSPGIEASLDVEYISAAGKNIPTWFISTSTYANSRQEDFLSWVVRLINTTDAPLVHSISYGDVEASIATDYLTRTEDEFAKIGISGRTLLFASGDSGVDCKHGRYTPMWPSSSPHVTAVGGTTHAMKVWRNSGGGFSNVFRAPDYQKEAIQTYFKRGDTPSFKYYNPLGRAYPDLNAFSVTFLVEYAKNPILASGTSCAAPTVAGIISLLNDVRLNQGMKPLGFLNPLLYQYLKGDGFIDTTVGVIDGGLSRCPGIKAGKGWDPASGWGSPNFKLLKSLVVNGRKV